MYVKRYLVLVDNEDEYPAILELPYETFAEAWDALKAEFERTVHSVLGQKHNILYVNGEAEMVDDDCNYELRKDGDAGPCFYVWNGDEITYKGVIREITVQMNEVEVERTYRIREQKYLTQDAERQLYVHLGYDPDAEEGSEEDAENSVILQKFEDHYGFSLSEAVNGSSDFYLLGDMVRLFEDKRDCNQDENATWDFVVQACLASLNK